jgi:hypothetical protein
MTGIRVWRLVQINRLIEFEINIYQKSLAGRNKQFLIHGNRFIEYLVFNNLNINQIDETNFEIPINQVKTITQKVIAEMIKVTDSLYPDSYLAYLFKHQAKCNEVAERINQNLNSNSGIAI